MSNLWLKSICKKCPDADIFWSIFVLVHLQRKFLHPVRILENKDQKKFCIRIFFTLPLLTSSVCESQYTDQSQIPYLVIIVSIIIKFVLNAAVNVTFSPQGNSMKVPKSFKKYFSKLTTTQKPVN